MFGSPVLPRQNECLISIWIRLIYIKLICWWCLPSYSGFPGFKKIWSDPQWKLCPGNLFIPKRRLEGACWAIGAPFALSAEQVVRLNDLFQKIIDELSSTYVYKPELLAILLMELAHFLIRNFAASKSFRATSWGPSGLDSFFLWHNSLNPLLGYLFMDFIKWKNGVPYVACRINSLAV